MSEYSASGGVADLRAGLERSWMWRAMAVQDIRLRYRGSIIGPWWVTLTSVVMIASMGFIYSRLFGVRTADYLPYLATGLVLWQFLSAIVNEAGLTFVSAQGIIHQTRMPLSIHAYRLVFRNLLVLCHNSFIVAAVLLIAQTSQSWSLLLFPFAMALLVFNAFWVALLFGIVSARYRDVPPIINNMMQVAFFVTPVFWRADQLHGDWKAIVECNPLFAAIDIARAPLLNAMPAESSWVIMLIMSAVGAGTTLLVFTRFRARIAYWL